jgi:hypothetical protein
VSVTNPTQVGTFPSALAAACCDSWQLQAAPVPPGRAAAALRSPSTGRDRRLAHAPSSGSTNLTTEPQQILCFEGHRDRFLPHTIFIRSRQPEVARRDSRGGIDGDRRDRSARPCQPPVGNVTLIGGFPPQMTQMNTGDWKSKETRSALARERHLNRQGVSPFFICVHLRSSAHSSCPIEVRFRPWG